MSSASNLNETDRCVSTRRVLLVPLLASTAIAIAGCCAKPEGRCGIADMCDPVVMADPFPNDQCVPPKGVDCGHYGYVRTSWRVLHPQDPNCCLMESPCMETIPQVMAEPIPAGAEKVDFQAILDADEAGANDLLAIAPVKTPVAEVSETADTPSYIRESVDVVRQAYGMPNETDVKLR